MLIAARNAMMTGKRIPYDSEVEFLQTDGTNYIATGITPPTNATVKTELTFGFASSSGRRFLFSDGNQNVTHYCEVNASAQYGAATAYISQTLSANTMYNATATFTSALASYSIDINGTQYTSSTTSYPSSAWRELRFFRISTEFRGAGQRIGACKIWVNGVLVRDFIPVRKGTVGYLYDRVSGKLFGNAGTGDFVLGPDVVPVEYIENVASSYINTEFKADNACKFEIDFENKKTSGVYNPWLFGSRNGSASAVDKSCVFLGYFIGTSYAMMGSATPTFNQGLVVSGRHALTVSLSEGVGIDGVVVATYTPSEQAQIYTNTHPNALFNMWNGSSLNNYFIGRVYSFKVLKNGVPQINFRPVRVGTDATSWEGAMMDVLTRRIYRNQGTGAFTYGNDLKYPIPAA